MSSTEKQEQKTIIFNKNVETLRKEIIELWEKRELGDISLREKIRTLAYEIEQTGIPTNKVSSTMIRMFKANIILGEYIAHTLDKKYKRQYTIQEILSGDRIISIEECSIVAKQLRDAVELAKQLGPEELGRREFQDIAEAAHELDHKCQDKAETYGISLSFQKASLGEGSKDNIVSLEAAPPPDDERVRVHAAHYVETLEGLRDDLLDMIEDIKERNYVAKDYLVEEQRNVGAIATRLLFNPHQDKKWQRFWREWVDILRVYYDHGGTKASSFSGVDVTGEINKKTGKPEVRRVTKEQIDAKYLPYLNLMRFMVLQHNPYALPTGPLTNVKYGVDMDSGKVVIREGRELTKEQLRVLHPFILDAMSKLLDNWTWIKNDAEAYKQTEEGYRAGRAFNLHDKLSNSA